MKTIPLEEVLKLATPGKLTADCMRIYTNDGEFWIASTDTPGPATDEEARANAALLAHSMNIRDDLIEALERIMKWADPYALPGCETNCKDTEFAKAVLQRAREVEMP